MAENNSLTAEQVEYVKSLPTRTVMVSEQEQTIAYDEEKRIVFFLDSQGRPTGRASKVDEKLASALHQPQNRSNDTRSSSEKESAINENTKEIRRRKNRKLIRNRLQKFAKSGEDDSHTQSKCDLTDPIAAKKKKRKNLFFLVCAVVAGISLFAFGSSNKPNDVDETQTSLNFIEVIQVTEDLIPGDQITANNTQKVTISAETYNQISLSSVNLYQWSRIDSLLDSYAILYIPKGQYLTYDNVNAVYQQPGNPWEKDVEGKTFVSIPIPEDVSGKDDITYGSMIDLTIVKETVLEVGEKTEETEEAKEEVKIEGLEHKKSVQQSSQVDTYGLSQIVVCDLLDESRNSLYPQYTSWISIPSGEQHTYLKEKIKENDALLTALSPSYIRIQVTNAQAEALGDLTGEDVQVNIKVLDKTDKSSDAKSLYTAGAKSLVDTLEIIQKELAEEAKGGDVDE